MSDSKVLKQPFYKKKWFMIIALLFVIGFVNNLFKGNDTKNESEQTETKIATEVATKKVSSEKKTTVVQNVANKGKIKLTAGELGKFSKKIVMNEGTDMPEELIVYYLPTGDYEVKNIGKFPAQVNVYEGFKRDEQTGYDDYTNGHNVLLEVDETKDINIPEGWFIEIQKPVQIELIKK